MYFNELLNFVLFHSFVCKDVVGFIDVFIVFLQIKISLLTDDSLEVSGRGNDAQCVCGGKSNSVRFYATPRAIGDLPVTATVSGI